MRPAGTIRVGILSFAERLARYAGAEIFHEAAPYLQGKFPAATKSDVIKVHATAILHPRHFDKISTLAPGYGLKSPANDIIAFRGADITEIIWETIEEIKIIKHIWEIFGAADEGIRLDYALITQGRESAKPGMGCTLLGDDIFIEEGATVNASILNSNTGPIYIGKNAEVMEGSIIRGPFSLGEHSALKLGAKIYGPTVIGPECKVGGEVNNSVFTAYSSKAHDGFIGNSVIGEWCNLGADSNNSNLKNNYEEVKVWDFESGKFVPTGLQFCGLFMGDHTKCGINTMFNTGTVTGVSSNIFGSGFPRTYIPNFAWGGAQGFSPYLPNKALATAEKVMARRNIALTEEDKAIFTHIFETTKDN